MHPGEYGNIAYIRPIIVRKIVDLIKEQGGNPFLTDTTVLYKGQRFNGVDLLLTAFGNGFSEASIHAPFVVADGLRGDDAINIDINGEYLSNISVASAICKADSMIVLSHSKSHPGSGYGGAVKNLGMGCLDKKGKTAVHEVGIPSIDYNKCTSCEKCLNQCGWNAFKKNIEGQVYLDKSLCKGELSCISCCPNEAIVPPVDCNEKMQLRLGEAALGPVKALNRKIGYINWAYDIAPLCDCSDFSLPNIAENIGILASKDPVAIDTASVDLTNEKMKFGRTGLIDLWDTDPKIHLFQAEKMNLGTSNYNLIKDIK
ncbi:DUF362 domain-containing protein [Methanosalsum natronophilum]|uniref:DUF362 domain-containing protein n=1 Tax=Methanosalsum natronophilum TaxID=768733 RepID=UPI00216771BB|nr:DUF362 domain-containing protein [Methanosalsum natronophilum]